MRCRASPVLHESCRSCIVLHDPSDGSGLRPAVVQANSLYNYQYVFTEYTLGRIEEGTLPIDGWRLDLNGKIEIEPGYWPDLREYWEIRKHVDFDPAFVQWMDENIVNH